MRSPVGQVRKMLLLVPEAWRAGTKGLPLERAVRVTGARSAKEIEEIVGALGQIEFGPSLPEAALLVSIEDGRVLVDRAMHLSSPPPLSLREGAALLAALRPFERNAGRSVASAVRKLKRAVPEPFRRDAESLLQRADQMNAYRFHYGAAGSFDRDLARYSAASSAGVQCFHIGDKMPAGAWT